MKTFYSIRSYVLGYNFNESTNKTLTDIFSELRIEYEHGPKLDELATIIPKIKFLLGIFVCTDNLDDDEAKKVLDKITSLNVPYYIFSSSPRSWSFNYTKTFIKTLLTKNTLKQHSEAFLKSLIIPGLEELSVFAFKNIYFNVCSNLNLNISYEKIVKGDYDCSIFIETISETLLGKCVVELNYKTIKEKNPELGSLVELMDNFGEFGNQFLSVINYNLSRLNLKTRIGLPTFFFRTTAKKISSIYIPSIYITDTEGLFKIKFGFLNFSKDKKLSFKSIKPEMIPDSIDFL